MIKLKRMEEKMREIIEAAVEEKCPCCGTQVQAAQSFDWRFCAHCNNYVKANEVSIKHVSVDHVIEMEDTDLVDDSGIGHELRDLLNDWTVSI